MNIGRKKKLFNLIIAATPELTLFLFDYSYITGHGKNKRVRRQSVAAVESADLSLPEFHLRPERRLDAIGSLLGRQDIDFDDHPEFSSAFVLKSDVEQQTRDFFDQELLDFFSGQPCCLPQHSGVYRTNTRRCQQSDATFECSRTDTGMIMNTCQRIPTLRNSTITDCVV